VSAPKIEIINPIRFFSFFGLFLVFLFLAFRSCSDKDTKSVKYVEAEKLSDLDLSKTEKANTEELSEFISGVKKDLTKQVKEKDLSAKELAKLEDQNANLEKFKKKLAKEKAQREKQKLADQKKKKAQAEKAKTRKVSKPTSGKTVIVRTEGGRMSQASRLELKRVVLASKQKSISKVMIYGYYETAATKGKAFIKAAEIKNALISLGIKRSVPIYMLTEQTRLPNSLGKVKFK
jgi:hypothetical protein